MRAEPRIIFTAAVSFCRPMPGWAARRFVGETPGCERLLVMPQFPAMLRRFSSKPHRPRAIFDDEYDLKPLYVFSHWRSSQLTAFRLADRAIWVVTRARPARSSGRRWAVRATWPRWFVANCSS